MTQRAAIPKAKEAQAVAILFLAAPAIVAIAFGISLLLKTPFPGRFAWTIDDALWGVAATAPLVLFLLWYMRTKFAFIAKHRVRQLEEFASAPFLYTPFRIFVMALGAGVSEEILFRGVLQDYAAGHMPVWLAILLTNVVFGLIHARSALYALIAGGIGCWLGIVYSLTDNLLAPIVAHALYDLVALEFIRRSFAAQPRAEAESASSVTG